MDIDGFWRLIELAGRDARPGNPDGNPDGNNTERFVANLEKLLREREPAEVISFRDHFEQYRRRAYDYDLWGAAFVAGRGCSDDWFHYFRCWLISMGREVYERVLADPDALVEPASRPEVEDIFFEELHYVPYQVYEDMTGTEMPDYPGPDQPREPTGTKQRDDGADLPARYPRLWARFGPRDDAR